jgi:DNA-binding NarL/FixJ family response regulator
MLKVFIVDDHQLVIEGLSSLLEKESQVKLVGSASNAQECLEYFITQTADVILMDISLPDKSGIELCKEMKTTYPGIAIVALSTFAQGSYITKMIENGANGYLLKNADKHEILEAIATVAKGKTYFSFEAGKIYKSTIEKQSDQPILSKREKEILKLIADGLTNLEIGKQLFISIDTVDTHRKNLYHKLDVKNTAQLIRKAIEQNLIT